jgi:hypothetical protein
MVPAVPARFFQAPKNMVVFEASNASWNIIYTVTICFHHQKEKV